MRIYIPEGISDCIVFNAKMRNYEQFLSIKSELSQILKNYKKEDALCFYLNKCHPLESYFVGYLLKLKENDQWNIKIYTNEYEVVKYFELIALAEKFEVTLRPYV